MRPVHRGGHEDTILERRAVLDSAYGPLGPGIATRLEPSHDGPPGMGHSDFCTAAK